MPIEQQPGFQALKKKVIETTGLDYYSSKEADLAHRLSRRFEALGLQDCTEYLNLLMHGKKGEAELNYLVMELTIGETYFFRHREQFEALLTDVMPSLITEKQSNRELRIWCAGCSFGAEPYTFAIMLRKRFAQALEGWQVKIIATDINSNYLKRASEGKFDEWAFRSTSEAEKIENFSREGKQWVIRPEHKTWVEFRHHNLMEDLIPSVASAPGQFDIVICRNVLIYFDSRASQKVISGFQQILSDKGWLILGHAEQSATGFAGLELVSFKDVTFYRKAELKPLFSPPLSYEPPVASSVGELVVQKSEPELSPIEQIRRLADQGHVIEAAKLCKQALIEDHFNPSLYFYSSLLSEQLGHLPEAEQFLKQAVYLKRDFALAHYYLGVLYQKQNKGQKATRCFQNVLQTLKGRPGGESIMEVDGLTVDELRRLAGANLEAA